MYYQGRRVVDVSHNTDALTGLWADPEMAWTASVRGWHRGYRPVGTGATQDAAVADLARQLGETVESLVGSSWVNS